MAAVPVPEEEQMNKSKFILFTLYLCGAIGFTAPQAQAMWFLDSIQNLVINRIGSKVMKMKSNDEASTSEQEQDLTQKTLKPAPKEGNGLFKKIVGASSDFGLKSAKGFFSSGDYSVDGVKNALLGQLSQEIAAAAAKRKAYEDMVEAKENEKLEKKVAMQKQMTILQSQHSALESLISQDPTPEREAQLDALNKAIADLALQIKENDEKDVLQDNQVREARKSMESLNQKISDFSAGLSESELTDKMNKMVDKQIEEQLDKLFDSDDDKDNEELYGNMLGRLFLKDGEAENSKNIKRVMDERKREYFAAVKNALDVSLQSIDSIKATNERSYACNDRQLDMADGIFGQDSMRLCVEMQNAIAAVGYMEMLLAMMQLDTTGEMQKWDNKYKLLDYNKDPTKFNLDDYLVTYEDFLKKMKPNDLSQIGDSAKGLVKDLF